MSLGVIHVQPEEQAFRDLCDDVCKKTFSTLLLEDCEPEFQRVVDRVQTHPEHRQLYASVFQDMVHTDTRDRVVGSHYLLGYCMRVLRWPEVADKIRDRMKDEWLYNPEGEYLKKILAYYHDA